MTTFSEQDLEQVLHGAGPKHAAQIIANLSACLGLLMEATGHSEYTFLTDDVNAFDFARTKKRVEDGRTIIYLEEDDEE